MKKDGNLKQKKRKREKTPSSSYADGERKIIASHSFSFRIKFVWHNLRGKRPQFIIGLLLTAITSIIVIVNPYMSKILVDDVIRGGKRDMLVPVLLVMSGVVLVKTGLHMLKIVMMEQASQNMLMAIRKTIFRNIQYQEMSFFDKIKSGDIITRTTGDLEYLRHFCAWVTYVTVDMVVTFTAAVVMLVYVSPVLTLALISVLPFILLCSFIYNKKVAPLYRSIRQRLSDLNVGASENINGNRVVKAFAREEYEKEKFSHINGQYMKDNMRAAFAWQRVVPVIDFLAQILTFLTILVGGALCINDSISLGDLTLFTGLTWALSDPMRQVSNILNDMQRFSASADKVIEIYYARPLICDRHNAVDTKERFKGKVEFRNVSFSYAKGSQVLSNVSFKFYPNETIAIMGPTGSGKTTIANLIARFYDVSSGEVLIDGVDVRDRTLESIHRGVSIATQDVFLFSDTVDGNISFCNPDMELEQVYECAELACADGFIRRMPEGYNTIIGERGVGLSGGQRQRIALARAIAAIPSILILDDTTSAVDMETEKKMQYNLQHLPFHCTTIIIAQRISSVRNADKIMILENGSVTIGTHDSLARTNRYYRNVCELQKIEALPPFEPDEANGSSPEKVKTGFDDAIATEKEVG